MLKPNSSIPWLTKSLKNKLKKKAKLYSKAKKSGDWAKYKRYQKKCKTAFRQEEWNYTNKKITEGLENKD